MDPATLAIIFFALGLGAISKGATGMGMPLIAVPIMTAFIGLQQSVAVLLIPILVSNAWQVWRFRAVRSDGRLGFLIPMLTVSAIGVIVGTWFLTATPERGLAIALGLLLIAYLVFRLAKPLFVVSPRSAMRWGGAAGLGAGLLHGATGISAPIGVTFIHAMRMERDVHVYAVSAMFLVLALVQAPALWVAGLLNAQALVYGTLGLIPIFLLMPLGQWLAGKLSSQAFDRMILAFLGLIGAKMVLGL